MLTCVSFVSSGKGTLSCRGRLVLMADADGATKFADVEKVEVGLRDLSPKPVKVLVRIIIHAEGMLGRKER